MLCLVPGSARSLSLLALSPEQPFVPWAQPPSFQLRTGNLVGSRSSLSPLSVLWAEGCHCHSPVCVPFPSSRGWDRSHLLGSPTSLGHRDLVAPRGESRPPETPAGPRGRCWQVGTCLPQFPLLLGHGCWMWGWEEGAAAPAPCPSTDGADERHAGVLWSLKGEAHLGQSRAGKSHGLCVSPSLAGGFCRVYVNMAFLNMTRDTALPCFPAAFPDHPPVPDPLCQHAGPILTWLVILGGTADMGGDSQGLVGGLENLSYF